MPQISCAFKPWEFQEAILTVTLRGKCFLNDSGQCFPSEYDIFADAIMRELETLLYYNVEREYFRKRVYFELFWTFWICKTLLTYI